MVDVGLDLLDGISSGAPVYHNINASQYESIDNNQYFAQHFWGEKNQGFDVLYHNMKYGQTSVKSLQEFLRESISTEDLRAKHLTKLAKQAANSSPLGSFAPMFEVFKVMAEKLSSCHMHVVQKLHEVVKDLSKYLDEQKVKHKQVKDELSGTVHTFHHVESTAVAVQKSKEKYYQLCMEAEKLKRAGGSTKETEKAETKARKASEEYKNLVEKYATMRNEYEQKMTESAKRFQETEVEHLKQMKKILDSYIGAYENSNLLVGQVHQEFRRQVDENTIDSLIKNYSESKGTGSEKPTAIVFEECDVGSMLLSAEQAQSNVVNGEEPASAPAPNKGRRPLNLPFRRKKGRRAKEVTNGSKENDKETESIESPEKDSELKVDEEGYTIRPETPKGSRSSWGYGSSDDSDSDTEDTTYRKIHVKIKPKDENASNVKENNLDTLNAITRNLTLSSPTPLGGKKLTRRKSSRSIGSPMTHMPVSRSGSIASNDIVATPPNSTPLSEFPTSFSPPKLTTPSKVPSIPGAIRVIPLSSSTPPRNQASQPVPAPRKISVKRDVNKLSVRRLRDANSQNRFSTAFVDQDEEFIKHRENMFAMPGKLNRDFSLDHDDEISNLTKSISHESMSDAHKFSPERYLPRLVPPVAPHPSPFSSSESILQPEILTPSPAKSCNSISFNSPSISPKAKPRANSDTPRPIGISKPSQRQLTSNSTNQMKTITIDPPAKQEKSTADELLDFFGNSSTSSAPTPASSDPNSFLDLFQSPPVSSSGDSSKKLPSSSSEAALNLHSVSSNSSRERKANKSEPFKLDPPVSSSKLTPPTSRPSNLTLNSSAPDLQKVAPLASAESWSSLSSMGGTPVESFATSRGPSPLTLSHGDPVPIAVSLAEIVNALFKGSTGDAKCLLKITGEVQISFPAGIVRAFTANKNPAVLSFAIKGCSNSVNFRPKHSFVFTDTSQTATSERSFWFDMPALTNYIKTITDSKPNAPYYNISVLNYEFLSQSGNSLAPLRLSSSWKCDTDSTEVKINYNFNTVTGSSLKAVQVLVPIDGGVTDHKSSPTATWNSSQNRLYWHFSSPISKSTPSGSLTSRLTLSGGPTKLKSLAVNFKSEGATVTGSEFELVGSGYRLSLVKKTFASGKYILDEN